MQDAPSLARVSLPRVERVVTLIEVSRKVINQYSVSEMAALARASQSERNAFASISLGPRVAGGNKTNR